MNKHDLLDSNLGYYSKNENKQQIRKAFEKAWENSGRDRLWFVVDVASFNVFDANENVRSWIRQRGHLVKTLPAFSRAKDRTIHIYLLE